jgi:hypothetical protein
MKYVVLQKGLQVSQSSMKLLFKIKNFDNNQKANQLATPSSGTKKVFYEYVCKTGKYYKPKEGKRNSLIKWRDQTYETT